MSDVGVHVVLVVVITQVHVVCVLICLKVALVSRIGGMTFAWGESHVIGVLPILPVSCLCFTSGFCIFSVLIEAPEWQSEDLVVEESTERQHDETEDGLVMEALKAEKN